MEQKVLGSGGSLTAGRPKVELKKRKSLAERAFEKIDPRKELKRLEQMLQDLKLEYEQFFLGLTPFQPEKLHREVRRQIRRIRKSPFKKPSIKFRQMMLEQRYQTYNDYWQRVLRQKEEGTYSKDLFKLQLKERMLHEEQEQRTLKGAANEGLKALFSTYKHALERQTGQKHRVDFEAFKKSLLKQARAHRERFGGAKLSFHVVVKGGKVVIKAKAKSAAAPPADIK